MKYTENKFILVGNFSPPLSLLSASCSFCIYLYQFSFFSISFPLSLHATLPPTRRNTYFIQIVYASSSDYVWVQKHLYFGNE